MANMQLEGKLNELGKFLVENGPGFLRLFVNLSKMFPKHTDFYKAGDLIGRLFEHLPE